MLALDQKNETRGLGCLESRDLSAGDFGQQAVLTQILVAYSISLANTHAGFRENLRQPKSLCGVCAKKSGSPGPTPKWSKAILGLWA